VAPRDQAGWPTSCHGNCSKIGTRNANLYRTLQDHIIRNDKRPTDGDGLVEFHPSATFGVGEIRQGGRASALRFHRQGDAFAGAVDLHKAVDAGGIAELDEGCAGGHGPVLPGRQGGRGVRPVTDVGDIRTSLLDRKVGDTVAVARTPRRRRADPHRVSRRPAGGGVPAAMAYAAIKKPGRVGRVFLQNSVYKQVTSGSFSGQIRPARPGRYRRGAWWWVRAPGREEEARRRIHRDRHSRHGHHNRNPKPTWSGSSHDR